MSYWLTLILKTYVIREEDVQCFVRNIPMGGKRGATRKAAPNLHIIY